MGRRETVEYALMPTSLALGLVVGLLRRAG
jgi:hypothetical protein